MVAMAAGSAVTDLMYNKIYNGVTAAGLLTGLAMQAAGGGAEGVLHALLRVGIAFALLFPVYMIRGIGGGDVKLVCAIAPFVLSVKELLILIAASFVAGAVIGAAILIFRRGRLHTFHFAIPVFIATLLMIGGLK